MKRAEDDVEARVARLVDERLRPVERRLGSLESATESLARQMEEDREWRASVEKRMDESRAGLEVVLAHVKQGSPARQAALVIACVVVALLFFMASS